MKYQENCVYAVEFPMGIKVGYTSRLGDRLSAFQKKHGIACYPVRLITGLSLERARVLERSLHNRLAAFSVSNEVFDVEKGTLHKAFDIEEEILGGETL